MDLIQFWTHKVLIITWGHFGYFTSLVAAIKSKYRSYIYILWENCQSMYLIL